MEDNTLLNWEFIEKSQVDLHGDGSYTFGDKKTNFSPDSINNTIRFGHLSSQKKCPWCHHSLIVDFFYDTEAGGYGSMYLYRWIIGCYCTFCGWYNRYEKTFHNSDTCSEQFCNTVLLKPNIDHYADCYEELKSVLKNKNEGRNTVTPYEFEKLIGDVFINLGYGVEYTKKSRDGGKDLVLLVNGKRYAFVEVKYHKDKIGVELIRQLRGVQLENETKEAIFVTSSSFTKDAKFSANKQVENYSMNLIDAESLLTFLELKKSDMSLYQLAQEGVLFVNPATGIVSSAETMLHIIPNHIIRKVQSYKDAQFNNGHLIVYEDIGNAWDDTGKRKYLDEWNEFKNSL